MKRTINIPLGATIREKREDGVSEIFVFRGSDAPGVIYETSWTNDTLVLAVI